MTSLICRILNGTSEIIYKTETDIVKKKLMFPKEEMGGGGGIN